MYINRPGSSYQGLLLETSGLSEIINLSRDKSHRRKHLSYAYTEARQVEVLEAVDQLQETQRGFQELWPSREDPSTQLQQLLMHGSEFFK